MTHLAIVALLAAGGIILEASRRNAKKRKEREEKQRLEKIQREKEALSLLQQKLPDVESAVAEFTSYLFYRNGYFSHSMLTRWQQSSEKLYHALKDISFEGIGLAIEQEKTASRFLEFQRSAVTQRDNYNKKFLDYELGQYHEFFDTVLPNSLDKQQREAIIRDEDNTIVIAGAGSGKTMTIMGKVNYVISRYGILPEEILLISFTKKSAETLAERISINGVEAKTFHKFGKDVITETTRRQPTIFPDAQYAPLIQKIFTALTATSTYLDKAAYFFKDFSKPYKSQFEFDNHGEYIQYLKDNNFRTYKMVETASKDRMTKGLEIVKSIEECRIANFLLFNGIDYEYEFPYEHETADLDHKQYQPDFKISQGEKTVYIEHFGINRNGEVPNWFSGSGELTAKEHYQNGIAWKRDIHARFGTTLIETYSYNVLEGTLYNELESKLTAAGIKLHPKTPQEIWQIINRNASEEVRNFITLAGTFITLMKSNDYTPNDLLQNIGNGKGYEMQRNRTLIELVFPIYDAYQEHLSKRGEIDFSDMINNASTVIRSGSFKRAYKYIIIDEFQDISIGRYHLIKAIKDSSPDCKLFCVGDDWQSIYRFAGSDIALFKEFESYFGITVQAKIETTYRFAEPLIATSGNFILKNPNQAQKNLKSGMNGRTDYFIEYSEEKDDTQALMKIFNALLKLPGIATKKIYILGRYGFDIARIRNTTGAFFIAKDEENTVVRYSARALPDGGYLEANFMTVHKSKGLEADIVIVINCNSGQYGFPSQISDDGVLNLLLSNADQFENGEERRLFYVAMTRAKEQLYLVADSYYKSKFIRELETGDSTHAQKKCGACKTGDMVLRKQGTAKNGNLYKFFGCTNYLYGCQHTKQEWTNLNHHRNGKSFI